MAQLGYAAQSSYPWASEDLKQVLQYLDARMEESTGIAKLKLLRDAFTLTILCETRSRGCTALIWRLQDILMPDGKPPPHATTQQI
jgi:hypothetical protein